MKTRPPWVETILTRIAEHRTEVRLAMGWRANPRPLLAPGTLRALPRLREGWAIEPSGRDALAGMCVPYDRRDTRAHIPISVRDMGSLVGIAIERDREHGVYRLKKEFQTDQGETDGSSSR